MISTKRQPIAPLGRGTPSRMVTNHRTGETAKEKIPSIPFTRKFVTPSGNVVHLTLATGRTIGSWQEHASGYRSVYAMDKMAQMRANGSLLYAECPYANGWLETPKGVKPCKGNHPLRQQVLNDQYNARLPPSSGANPPMKTIEANVPGAFWRFNENNSKNLIEDECCPHIEEIITERQAKQAAQQREFEEQTKSSEQKSLDRLFEIKRLELQPEPPAPMPPEHLING